jgi:glycerophosphoryl diester phosphodiesterase
MARPFAPLALRLHCPVNKQRRSVNVLNPPKRGTTMPLLSSLPLVLGHRGSPAEAPENTLRSFALALTHGADGVELDVQPSADGVPVVIHDATLERTTNARGAVAALPWTEISGALAGGEPVPHLEQIAVWAAGTGAWLNVELKTTGAEAASLNILRAAGVLEHAVFSSFVPAAVAEVRRLAPHARAFLLTEQWDAVARQTLTATDALGVCLGNAGATPAVLRKLRHAGLPVIVWTVNDAQRMHHLLSAGVAAIITNFPALGVEVRNALCGG